MNKLLLVLPLLFLSCACSSQQNSTIELISNIRKQFLKINSQINQYDKVEKEILGESAEGGMIMGYYDKGNLKKISVAFYGETGKTLSDFYINDGTLFFLFKQTFNYNKPIYIEDSKVNSIEEDRYYFDNDKLIEWLKPKNIKEPNNSATFKEAERNIIDDFNHYKQLLGAYHSVDYKTLQNIDTVKCKFGPNCLGTGYVIKGSRTSSGNVIHVSPRNKDVPIEK